MTFLFGKKQALKSYHKIKKWEAKNIIISHGPCIDWTSKRDVKPSVLLAREIGLCG